MRTELGKLYLLVAIDIKRLALAVPDYHPKTTMGTAPSNRAEARGPLALTKNAEPLITD